jgi:hypothetical protein
MRNLVAGSVRELKAPEALAGMHGHTLIVVKLRNRKGYMPSPMLARAVKEAQRRGVPIEEQIVAWGERERA